MRFKNEVVKWLQRSCVGVGTGLLASASFAIMIGSTPPLGVVTGMVGGLLLLVADLAISLAVIIPKGD